MSSDKGEGVSRSVGEPVSNDGPLDVDAIAMLCAIPDDPPGSHGVVTIDGSMLAALVAEVRRLRDEQEQDGAEIHRLGAEVARSRTRESQLMAALMQRGDAPSPKAP